MASRPATPNQKAAPDVEASAESSLVNFSHLDEIDKAAERRLLRKLDLVVLPLLGTPSPF
jgi:hypothetical protein